MSAPLAERTACLECDLVIAVGPLAEGERASCPRCGHVVTSHIPDGRTRALACSIAALTLLLLANSFPFLRLEASGIEQVMTLPGSAQELFRDGYQTLAVLVLGPIVGIPGLMLLALVALLVPLESGLRVPWLVPAGRALFMLGPWSMVEVFVIGVLVSLVKIVDLASVVMGVSFWAYLGFSLCFVGALASLDRFRLWQDIEELTS